MDQLVIEIGSSGHVAALHMDDFDLGFLGDKDIYRQTDIKFCKDGQDWSITYLGKDGVNTGGVALSFFTSYERARGFEVRWLNECRRLGQHPAIEGMELAKILREEYGS